MGRIVVHEFITLDGLEQAKRIAPPPTDDDRTVLVGMDRPATPDELTAFVDRENARIQREHGLPPAR